MKKLNFKLTRAFLYITLLCTITATLFSTHPLDRSQKVALEGFSVGVVGKEVVTHKDVLDRLAMEAFVSKIDISRQSYGKLYRQAAYALVNESRQRQAPARLVNMIKKIHQTHAADALLPSEIKKEVESRMETMAKNNNMTIAQFRGFLGPHYYSFYRRQESMVAFQRFLMVKSGPRAMRNIVSTAIAKARKKWKALQGADQYRISEIIIYNRGEAGFSRDKIAELAALLSSGEAFSELASRSSESRTSQNNGDCGWHILDYFDRPIQDFLKNASIGDISPIIPLPTPRNPEKWALILVTDRRSPLKNGALSEAEKDPGDEVFRNNLFAAELERLSKAEMEDLEKSFPCTLNIGKKMTMPSS